MPTGTEFSLQDCKSAGLSLGNKLRHGTKIESDWSDSPCGCFAGEDVQLIHYHYGTTCSDYSIFGYALICKETDPELDECFEGIDTCHTDAICKNIAAGYTCACKPGYSGNGKSCKDIYVQLAPNIATKCPTGTEVNLQDCESAGLSLGNKLGRSGTVEGDWTRTPCGCFAWGGSKVIHYHYGSTCSLDKESAYELICKKPSVELDECSEGTDTCHADATCKKMAAGYTCACKPGYLGNGKSCTSREFTSREYDQLANNAAKKCPDGIELDLQECQSAGLSLGLSLGDSFEGDWFHTPCGCFFNPDD
jgi:hypothetical protein